MSNQNKSFEELCYQLVFEEYSSKGQLTSIDDSHGGDGVEFYLKLTQFMRYCLIKKPSEGFLFYFNVLFRSLKTSLIS
ncbi:hypothetical protein [Aquimarina rhabdastrellae]